jgi:DNA replication protein DnaC
VSEHTIPDIEPLLKRLSLANTRRTYRELIRRAEGESWTYGQFLQTVASEEIAHRRQTRINRLTHRAGFPFLKTIEEFDFSFQSTLRLNLLGSVLSPDFITDGRTLVLIGKPGRGKTHLAVATAYKHIQSGFEALFVTAAKMIDHLSGANGSLRILRNANTDDGIAFPVPEKVDILVGSLHGGPPECSVSSLNTLYGGSPSCYFLFPANVR